MKITMDRFAAMSVMYWHFSFDYFLDSMEKCGIKNIEMWPGEPHYFRYDYNSSGEAKAAIREMRKKIDAKGMKVIMYTPETLGYPFNPAGKGAYRQRTIDMYKYAMEDALEFGTNNFFLNPGWGLRDEPAQEAWDRAVETFKTVAEFGKKLGIQFHLEQLQPYESNLATTAADLGKMVSDVGADNVTACLDIGAMAEAGDTIEDFYKALPGKITHVHFSDRNHEALGDRDLPLTEYLDDLAKRDFSGYFTLEVNDGMYIEDPHSPFMRTADWLRANLPRG